MEIEQEEFIVRLKKGEEKAFLCLVENNKQQIVNVCFSFLGNVCDAEDVAQEVFIEVYHSISKFKFQASLQTWIYRIAVNKSLDLIKKNNRKKRNSKMTVRIDDSTNFNHLSFEKETPIDKMMDEEVKTTLRAAIHKLPDKHKSALILTKLEGMKQKEVSNIMGITEAALESYLVRARKQLKEMLQVFYLENYK